MWFALLSVITSAASVASFLTVRQMKKDHDAALKAIRPFAEGLAAATKLIAPN
jgi:hypothetical protein